MLSFNFIKARKYEHQNHIGLPVFPFPGIFHGKCSSLLSLVKNVTRGNFSRRLHVNIRLALCYFSRLTPSSLANSEICFYFLSRLVTMEGRCSVQHWTDLGFSASSLKPKVACFGTDVFICTGSEEVFVFNAQEKRLTASSCLV